ncbi:hypothetical protein AB0L88_17240 [Saccharopolyspora shandongensis]|uniref:hypothetical protein n=1 Tax=Saccharopolyspora shandongensis TaxID=418495 RepID=UPI00341A289F
MSDRELRVLAACRCVDEQVSRDARQSGEMAADAEVPQLVFELAAFLDLANAESVLHEPATARRPTPS